MIDGIGSKTITRIAKAGIDWRITEPCDLCEMLKEIAFKVKLPAKRVRSLTRGMVEAAWNRATKIVEENERAGIALVSIIDPDYPEVLLSIPSSPVVLYTRGDTGLLKKRGFAVTGSPRPTEYGIHSTVRLAHELLAEDGVIMNGLNEGIENAAAGAYEGGTTGNVVGILAGGLDQIYPPSKKSLSQKVLNGGGLLISEHTLGKQPDRYTAVSSDKIMVALSTMVLVVESAANSDIILTCTHAKKSGKPVYVLEHSAEMANYSVVMGLDELVEKFGAIRFREISEIL